MRHNTWNRYLKKQNLYEKKIETGKFLINKGNRNLKLSETIIQLPDKQIWQYQVLVRMLTNENFHAYAGGKKPLIL